MVSFKYLPPLKALSPNQSFLGLGIQHRSGVGDTVESVAMDLKVRERQSRRSEDTPCGGLMD